MKIDKTFSEYIIKEQKKLSRDERLTCIISIFFARDKLKYNNAKKIEKFLSDEFGYYNFRDKIQTKTFYESECQVSMERDLEEDMVKFKNNFKSATNCYFYIAGSL